MGVYLHLESIENNEFVSVNLKGMVILMRWLRRNTSVLMAVLLFLLVPITLDSLMMLVRRPGLMSLFNLAFVVIITIITYVNVDGFRGAWRRIRRAF